MTDLWGIVTPAIPLLATLGIAASLLAGVNAVLRRRWKDVPDAQFQFQLIMLGLTLACMLAVVAALPVGDVLRGQLLSLIGLLLSAAIALSSTTFIGNILAGIMLKTIRKARPGDFITVAELTGRITEMDLLHTEIQTEFRDLVTVPNIFMVTQPLKVVRASGSIITGEVSLGYDVPHHHVKKALLLAAESAGLTDCFVHVRELGDFAITYRVAGLLEDIRSLISAKSALLTAMLDALSDEGIEIVSPNFMNTRQLATEHKVLPRQRGTATVADIETLAEDIAFDKAEDAASAEKIREALRETELALEGLKAQRNGEDNDQQLHTLKRKQDRLEKLLAHALAQIKTDNAD
ncbi:mechanosensitive ion channel family protein [Congregibacter litoralis]|uniref:Small-conductance mechanosensitive channel n=1 Tax=Congregibacter litoralis KT71 TaxID=314285 RepID=A4ADA4_9GAMM|nr:mechanosensitive ion channel family protein [Congregibacter litoralis]EAQ96028.1 Small-conductance mechanosensitive channel [Congregibacter litoralis KT71]